MFFVIDVVKAASPINSAVNPHEANSGPRTLAQILENVH